MTKAVIFYEQKGLFFALIS